MRLVLAKGCKENKGFTLVEMIVVMLLLSILLALSVGGLLSWQDWSDFNQANEYAQTMFFAAQNQLSEYDSNGTLSDFAAKAEQTDGILDLMDETNGDDAKLTRIIYSEDGSTYTAETVWATSEEQGTLVSVCANKGDYDLYKSGGDSKTTSKTASLVFQLLEQYFYDTSVLNGAICIEFSPSDGQVFGVFYCEKSDESDSESFVYNNANENLRGDVNIATRYESYRRERMVGYYGADTLSHALESDKQVIDAEVQLYNDKTLNLTIKLDDDTLIQDVEYEITVNDKESGASVLKFTLDGTKLSKKASASAQKCEVTHLTGSGESTGTYPILAWLETDTDNRQMVRIILDAADLQATSASYISEIVDHMENGILEDGVSSSFGTTYSFHRFGVDAEKISCTVEASGETCYMDAPRESNTEYVYFEDVQKTGETETAVSYQYQVKNARHLYNMRYVTDLSDETDGSSASELRRSSSKYTGLADYCEISSNFVLTADIDWKQFVDDGYYYNTANNGITASSESYTITGDFVSMKQLRDTDSFTGVKSDADTTETKDENVYTISNLNITKLGNDLSGLYGEMDDTDYEDYEDVDCTFGYNQTLSIDSRGRYNVRFDIWGKNTSSKEITNLKILLHVDYEIYQYGEEEHCKIDVGNGDSGDVSAEWGSDVSLGAYKKTVTYKGDDGKTYTVKNTGVEKTWLYVCDHDYYKDILINNEKEVDIASFGITFANYYEYKKFKEGLGGKYWIKYSYEGGVNSISNSANKCYITTVLEKKTYSDTATNVAARYYPRIWNYSEKPLVNATVEIIAPEGVTLRDSIYEDDYAWRDYVVYDSIKEWLGDDGKWHISITFDFSCNDGVVPKQTGQDGYYSNMEGIYIPLDFTSGAVYKEFQSEIKDDMQNRDNLDLTYGDTYSFTYKWEEATSTSSKCYLTLDNPVSGDDSESDTFREYKVTIHNESEVAMKGCYFEIHLSNGITYYYDTSYGTTTGTKTGDYYLGEQTITVTPKDWTSVEAGGEVTSESFLIKGGNLKITDITLYYNGGDGRGATGIVQKDMRKPVGLFVTSAGTIRNMNLADICVTSAAGYAGGFCGVLVSGDGTGILKNLAVRSTNADGKYSYIQGGGDYVGGIAGYVEGFDLGGGSTGLTLSGLINEAKVTGSSYVGGIVSALETADQKILVENCENYGAVYAKTSKKNANCRFFGGIVGLCGNLNEDVSANSNLITIKYCKSSPQYSEDDLETLLGESDENLADSALYAETVVGDYVGGLVGYSYYAKLENVTAEAADGTAGYVIGRDFVGGIAGYYEAKAELSGGEDGKNENTVVGRYYVGGIVGANAKLETNMESVKDQKTDSPSAYDMNKSISGTAILSTEVSDAKISGWTNTGVVCAAGKALDETGEAIGAVAYAGGIVGYNMGVVEACTQQTGDTAAGAYSAQISAAITAVSGDYVGGITGYNGGTVTVTGASTVSMAAGNSNYVGGVAGYNNGEITLSAGVTVNRATVAGNYVGGIAGYNKGEIAESGALTSTVNLSATGSYVGGIAGYNIGSMIAESETVTATVIGDSYVGGVVGCNDSGAVVRNYAVTGGTITGAGNGCYTGGLAGCNSSVLLLQDESGNAQELSVTGTTVNGGYYVGGVIGGNVVNTDGYTQNSVSGGASSVPTDVATTTSAGQTTGLCYATFTRETQWGDNLTMKYNFELHNESGESITDSYLLLHLPKGIEYTCYVESCEILQPTDTEDVYKLVPHNTDRAVASGGTTWFTVIITFANLFDLYSFDISDVEFYYTGGDGNESRIGAGDWEITEINKHEVTNSADSDYDVTLTGDRWNAYITLKNNTNEDIFALQVEIPMDSENELVIAAVDYTNVNVKLESREENGQTVYSWVITPKSDADNRILANSSLQFSGLTFTYDSAEVLKKLQDNTRFIFYSTDVLESLYQGSCYQICANVQTSGNTVSGTAFTGGAIGYAMLMNSSDSTALSAAESLRSVVQSETVTTADNAVSEVQTIERNMEAAGLTSDVQLYVTGTTGGKVTAQTCAGGLVGYDDGNTFLYAENAVNNAGVTASGENAYAGGILGYSAYESNRILSCRNTGPVTAQKGYAGAIIGCLAAGAEENVISGCTNTGIITGQKSETSMIGYPTGSED